MDNITTRTTGDDFYSIFAGCSEVANSIPSLPDLPSTNDGDDGDDFDYGDDYDALEVLDIWATDQIVKAVQAGGEYVEADIEAILDTYYEKRSKLLS